MNPDIENALTILVVGMTTVFVILLLVVLSARLIIWITNLLAEKEEALLFGRAVRASTRSSVPRHHQRVISKVVDEISGSRAVIVHISKSE